MKIREGQVSNRPVYVAMGITVDGDRDVLGLWAGPAGGGEGARARLGMLTDLKNRGVKDVLIACCDGLKCLPEAITATWPQTTVQSSSVDIGAAGRSRWSPAPPRAGPMQSRTVRGPDADPSARGGGGLRIGQREQHFERRDEVPTRPASPAGEGRAAADVVAGVEVEGRRSWCGLLS